MIKFEIDSKNNIQELECAGSPFELAMNVGMLMGVIYAQTQALNPMAAKILRKCFEANVRDDAPTWYPPRIVERGVAGLLGYNHDQAAA